MEEKLKFEKTVGRIMKKIRQEKQLKRYYVATNMGISESLYAKLEQGNVVIKFSHVFQFCQALGINCQIFTNALTDANK